MLKLLSGMLIFTAGVIKVIAGWALALYRYECALYRKLKHVIARIISVGKRISSHYKKAVFIYRFLHYAFYRLHLQPRWAKIVQVIIIAAVISQPYLWEYVEHRREVSRLYEFYYGHFYEQYYAQLRGQYGHRESADRSRYYAGYYANYYAEYFTSDAYHDALRYALPAATRETTTISTEDISEQNNAALAVTDSGVQLIKNHEKLILKPYLTDDGVGLIQDFEGFKETPYRDVGGKLTVGYGHLVRKGENFDTISHSKAEAIFRQDIKVAETYVKKLVEVPLNPNQFSALVSLVYNIGPVQFKRSTLLKKLNKRDYAGAAEEFPRWKYVGKQPVDGLLRRRIAERKMFASAWKPA